MVGRVAVLYGGESCEREVSLASGEAIWRALCAKGVEAELVDSKNKEEVLTLKTRGFTRAFIALHGRGGEDGVMQGLLDWQGLPYTGSGVLACALAMDKVLTKQIWQAQGLPVKPDCLVEKHDTYQEIVNRLGAWQFVIKPALEGSSVGVSCVQDALDFDKAWTLAGGEREKIMAEPWIVGRELSVAIVGECVLPAVEIVMPEAVAFYDFSAKYVSDKTGYLCPAPLTQAQHEMLADLAWQAFTAVGAKGWGRVDVMLDEEGQFWLLEVNLVPGMTSHSLVPMAAAAKGMAFEELVMEILRQTLEG